MTKSELTTKLINRMAHVDNLTENDIAATVNTTLELICESLEQGHRIEIRGFGSFCLHRWGKRHARHPKTGKTWRTDPAWAVYFKPGKEMRERVNLKFLEEQQAGAHSAKTVKTKEKRVLAEETE